ncbi:MAG: GNAT family N-acetyltransferase [Chlamydiia bacterium]|nr:GNAT family N-acetyltransferase [Chlamydiia bacterium]
MNIPDQSEYDIRYSKMDDLPFLEKWLGMERAWYPISSDKDVENMSKNWIGFHRFGASLTATYKGEVAGIATLFLMPYRKVIHHCLLYFIVNPDMRGQGVGTSIIKNINHLGKSYFRFEWINAEVWEGCPAIPILEKGGYKEVIRQEKYVKEKDGTYRARHVFQANLSGEANGK